MRLRTILAAAALLLILGLSGCDPGQTTWKLGNYSPVSASPMEVQP